jgi:hypothetical protein
MAVTIEDGYLVERFSRSGRVRRRARIVPVRPVVTKYDVSVTTEDGQRYITGWVYPPGIRQGHAVAWPVD